MHHLLLALLLAAAASGAEPATGAAVPGPRHRHAGPWQVWNGRSLQVAISFIAPLDDAALARLSLEVDGQALALRPVQRHWPREGGAYAVVEWQLPAAGLRPVPFAVVAPNTRWGGILAPPPRRDDPVRLAVANPLAWPRPEQLAALEAPLGGPVQGVLVPGGRALERVLGHSGWEANLALVPLCEPAAVDDPVRAALLGPAVGAFPHGLRWGLLGLPTAAGFDAVAAALGQVGGEWQVFVQPQAAWDLSLLAPAERGDPRPHTAFLRLCASLRLPLVLAGGELAGFVSEPLSTGEDGLLAGIAGGCRYVVAAAAGGGLAALPPLVAAPLDRSAGIGLTADDDRLRLAVLPDDAPGDLRTWTWERWAKDAPPPAGGWGGGEAKPLRDALVAAFGGGSEPPPEQLAEVREIAAAMTDLARPALRAGEPGRDEFRLLLADGGDGPPPPWRRFLALHLLADDDLRAGRVRVAGDLPVWAQREAVLRALGEARPLTAWWSGVIADTADPALVHAAILLAERKPSLDLLAALVERLRRQAAGTTAIDPDPLLQSRLTSTVFDSPYLSPTPLRPIALALKDRLDPLGRGPLVRFLERRGSERK
jgi:hypothetical protein